MTGNLLKNERQKRNLTLQQVEEETRIREKNLEAVENNDWREFPSETYTIGILKSYGDFLGINQEKLLAIFRREYEKKDESDFKKTIHKTHFTPYAQRLFRVFLLLILLIFLSYFGYQLKLYFSPPSVTIISPRKFVFKRENKIELIGKTEKESIVMVNGERVYQNKDMTFKIILPLTNSENIVVIEVTGANGRKTTVKKVFKKG